MTWPSGGVVRKSSIRKLPSIRILEPKKFFYLLNPELEKFLFVKSGIPDFGIQITAQGIWNPR